MSRSLNEVTLSDRAKESAKQVGPRRPDHSMAPYKLMTPKNAKCEFEKLIKESGTTMRDLTAERGVRLMLDFYRDVRADGCDLDSDGDMLLFQWGTDDFGEGPSFRFNMTRQFILEETEDDEGITQFSLTFHFTTSPELDALTDGNRWCSMPDDLKDFESFINSGEAYRAVGSLRPVKVTLDYSGV